MALMIYPGYYPEGRQAGWLDVGWGGPAGQSYSSAADLAKVMFLAFSTNKSIGEEISQVCVLPILCVCIKILWGFLGCGW